MWTSHIRDLKLILYYGHSFINHRVGAIHELPLLFYSTWRIMKICSYSRRIWYLRLAPPYSLTQEDHHVLFIQLGSNSETYCLKQIWVFYISACTQSLSLLDPVGFRKPACNYGFLPGVQFENSFIVP